MTNGTIEIDDHVVLRDDGTPVTLRGRLLGYGSSRRDYHNHEMPRPAALLTNDGRPWKCSGCRWFEVRIYHLDDGSYALHTVGMSSLDGEKPLPRLQFTESAYEVIEMLTDKRGPVARIPEASARCLAQAANVDDKMNEAYINRAVV